MKGTDLLVCVKSGLNRAAFQVKKYSPEILIITGTIGVVTSTVMACKATTKFEATVAPTKEKLEGIRKAKEDGSFVSQQDEIVEYTEEDARKDTTIEYAKLSLAVAKLYAPAVSLGVFSLGCMIASNHILRKRNAAIAAAYAAVTRGFKEYRERVVERFGSEVDRELKYNIKKKVVEEVITDEKGKEKVVKKEIDVVDPNTFSEYARFFDETCLGHYSENPEHNMFHIKSAQNYLNDLLVARGHVYLNEAYDALGMPRTKAGQIVGWVYDKKAEHGDNFIDFGIFNANLETNREFVNGYKPVVLLDFNVDGNILDLM